MPRYVVDSEGATWDAADPDFPGALGDAEPDYDLISYGVRNLGFIDIDVRAAETIVRFRWLAVSQKALLATAQLLPNVAVGEVKVVCEQDVWTETNFEDPNDASAWIEARAPSTDRPRLSRDIRLVPRRIEALADRRLSGLRDTDDKLALLFKKWRLSSGVFTPQVTMFMTKFGLLDRAVLARKRDDAKIVFEHVGTGLNVYAADEPDWAFRLHGMPVSEQADREYAVYTDQMFRDCLEQRQPRLDHVDAMVRGQRTSHRTRYDRLIVPWTSEAGESIVTTLSYKTDVDVTS